MMRKLFSLSACFLLFLFASCEGPVGPRGPQGPQGPQGDEGPEGLAGPNSYVLDFENVDFEAPEYAVRLDFEYQAYSTDAVLVYGLWYTEETDDSQLREVWRQFPQSIFLDGPVNEEGDNEGTGNRGELVYNFSHTDVYADVFLEADFDIAEANLGPNYLNNWVIRVVIVPGQFLANARGASLDFGDYKAVKKYFNLSDKPAPTSQARHSRPEVKQEE